jgi:hypothetical protein
MKIEQQKLSSTFTTLSAQTVSALFASAMPYLDEPQQELLISAPLLAALCQAALAGLPEVVQATNLN